MPNIEKYERHISFVEGGFSDTLGEIPSRFSLPVVYVLDMHDTKFVKIGSTQNIKSRFYGLQSATPFRVSLAFYYCPPEGIFHIDVEKRAHSALQEFHIRGEWFACSWVFAKDAIMAAGLEAYGQ